MTTETLILKHEDGTENRIAGGAIYIAGKFDEKQTLAAFKKSDRFNELPSIESVDIVDDDAELKAFNDNIANKGGLNG